ncbi:MAG TPA: NADPH:quinone reductase [Thermoanaerobaculia bacterium]|jgi:NADPH2:quinone reductase|nr:NADPH:quinone reductase [Thermoanaerobaculia bacterium]
MKAAWYERQGAAREVLVVGTMADPLPGPGEVRLRVAVSGVNPGDVKKRRNTYGYGMPYPRVVPHSDGAGTIDELGEGVGEEWLGRRVWCYGAQSYRPFGTAAELVVVPLAQAVPLADTISFEVGACLGIPGITAHRALHVAGPVAGRTVLVHGGAGAVGACAVALARHAGARVIASVRSEEDVSRAAAAGAHEVVRAGEGLLEAVRGLAPSGVDHVVEAALGANAAINAALLAQGGSIAAYATDDPQPKIPFWPLVFQNATLYFLGSDDFPPAAKVAAAREVTAALAAGWPGPQVARRFPLDDVAGAHEAVEGGAVSGRVVVVP